MAPLEKWLWVASVGGRANFRSIYMIGEAINDLKFRISDSWFWN